MENTQKPAGQLWLPLHAVVSSVKNVSSSQRRVTKKERKRAHAAAQFYSECSLRGILPSEADSAAIGAQERHDKWWIRTKYKTVSEDDNGNHEMPASKRRRNEITLPECEEEYQTHSIHMLSEDEFSHKRPASFSDESLTNSIRVLPASAKFHVDEITHCKRVAIDELQKTGGDTQSKTFVNCLKVLESSYSSRKWDARWSSEDAVTQMDGKWLTLSKPTFAECLGTNDQGDYRYTLGRLSFDMFRPTKLTCSIQGVYNFIGHKTSEIGTNVVHQPLIFPVKLKEDLRKESIKSLVRNFEYVKNLISKLHLCNFCLMSKPFYMSAYFFWVESRHLQRGSFIDNRVRTNKKWIKSVKFSRRGQFCDL
jgi:hypothetical protein